MSLINVSIPVVYGHAPGEVPIVQPIIMFKEPEVDLVRYAEWKALLARKTPLCLTPNKKRPLTPTKNE
jgi:hypothetical protein